MEAEQDAKEEPTESIAKPQATVFKKPVLIGKIGRLPRKVVSTTTSTSDKNTPKPPEDVAVEDSTVNYIPDLTNVKPIKAPAQQLAESAAPLPYKEPPWSGLPHSSSTDYVFEVLKSGMIVEHINLMAKPFWVFGRSPNCEIYMAHPTVSRYHAVLQFRKEEVEGNPPGFYIYDLNSTHGTFLNKGKLKPRVYAPVKVGHIIKMGFSTRSYVLTGPEEDAEEESEFTVTELKQQRAEKLRQAELDKQEALAKEETEKEEQRKRDEARGVDWGLGEDADEETDLSENPFAQTNNEELYIDDPKKALRGFMEREGYELEYDCSEQGFGQFLCRVELPLDDDHGRPIVAEVLHKGKKKEAVAQCALEACKILDRYGVLRQATHESRKRKAKNWEENDFYDSDDDTFLDRTGTIEKKREKRMQAKVAAKPETYQSLMEKEKQIREKIANIQQQLSRANNPSQNSSQDAEEDPLDSFMKQLKQTKLDKQTVSKLKSELVALKAEHVQVVKLANLAKPADLPPLIISDKEAEAQGTSGKQKGLPLFGKRKKVKVQLPAKPGTSERMDTNEDEEEEEENEEKTDASEEEKAPGPGKRQPKPQDPLVKVHVQINEIEKFLTDNQFPSGLSSYVSDIKDVMSSIKDLMADELKILDSQKTIMAKNIKIQKHIDNLRDAFNEQHLLKICKGFQRNFAEILEVVEKKHHLSNKIKILSTKIDLLCKQMDAKSAQDEHASDEENSKAAEKKDSGAEKKGAKREEAKEEEDERDDKELTPDELEKRRKRNQRRLQHRRERAEMEKQKGYAEDARKEDYNMWVPPKNQTGDGRTSLNDKYGY